MTDRIPTQVLNNGALRYAEYDSTGALVQYRYLALADEPTIAGTPLNKNTLLTDAVASILGLSGDSTVSEALNMAASRCRIQTGTYTGNGTFGAGNANSLTFDFVPSLVYICPNANGYGAMWPWLNGAAGFTVQYLNTLQYCTVSISGNAITWYGTYNEGAQLNTNGIVYSYIAIGDGIDFPAIIQNPSDTTVNVGEVATFRVTALGKGLTYQWRVSTNGGRTWANSGASGNTTDTLSVTTQAVQNGFLFKCRVTQSGTTIESTAATLTVNS